jgi:hypothetical protein
MNLFSWLVPFALSVAAAGCAARVRRRGHQHAGREAFVAVTYDAGRGCVGSAPKLCAREVPASDQIF